MDARLHTREGSQMAPFELHLEGGTGFFQIGCGKEDRRNGICIDFPGNCGEYVQELLDHQLRGPG